MPRPVSAPTVAGMPSALVEEPCPGSRGPAAEPGDDQGMGICPACGRRLPLGYANLLPAHEPLATDGTDTHIQDESP